MARAVESRRELPAESREMAREWPTSLLADEPLAGWWDAAVRQPLWSGTTGYDTLLDDLVGRTLQYSLEVKAASQQVLIRQTMIEEAYSVFDWATFLESKWKDLDEPVGNALITGGPPRLLHDQMVTKAGVRRRNELGGELEFSQQLGTEHSNSLFFVPPNQGQSRLALSYRQPLLRGAGRKYNRALIAWPASTRRPRATSSWRTWSRTCLTCRGPTGRCTRSGPCYCRSDDPSSRSPSCCRFSRSGRTWTS